MGIARSPTFATPPILLEEFLRRFFLRDGFLFVGEIIKNEVQTLAAVDDVVPMFARCHISEAGEVLCCTLDFLHRASMIAWPVHTIFVALRGYEGGQEGEGGEDLHFVGV